MVQGKKFEMGRQQVQKNSLYWSLNENLYYYLDSHVYSAQYRNIFNMPRFSNFLHAFTVVCIYFSKVQERLVLLIIIIYSWNACFICSRKFSYVLLQPSESVLLYSSKGIQYHIIQYYQYHIAGSFPITLMISKRVPPYPSPPPPPHHIAQKYISSLAQLSINYTQTYTTSDIYPVKWRPKSYIFDAIQQKECICLAPT